MESLDTPVDRHSPDVSAATQRLAHQLGLTAEQCRGDRGYESATEHLFDLLCALSVRLKRYLLLNWPRITTRGGQVNDALVSLDEVMAFYGQGSAIPSALADNFAVIDDDLHHWQQRIQRRLAAAPPYAFLPFEWLRHQLGLEPIALDLLLAAAAPSLDPAFERMYRLAWADFARLHTPPFFLGALLADDPAGRAEVHATLQASHPLRRLKLVTLIASRHEGPEPPSHLAHVVVPQRVIDFLMGERTPDEDFLAFLRVFRHGPRAETLVIPEQAKDSLRMALKTAHRGQARIIVSGPEGVGKVSLIRALAMERRRPVVVVDLLRLADGEDEAHYQLVCSLREALLQGADLVLDDSRGAFKEERDVGNLLDPILWIFENAPVATYYVTHNSPMWLHGRRDDLIEVEFGLAPPRGQRELWRRILLQRVRLCPHVDLADIVQRYSLSAGSIHRAAAEALRLAEMRDDRGAEVRIDDIVTAVRHQFHHRLGALAQPISTTLDWKDVVLKPDLITRIREIISFARHRETVYDKWGFRRKMSYGRGLTCLFSGAPGTGKTMMVCIIARELGRELFRVDVARVVDKYIGETEKNLAKVFDEAERSQAIILFDEADSLFAKRTEVKSSHDRYANLEVNYLLQRMEQFDGATFLTTNFETSIDEAFERRLKFKLTFPMPDEDERKRLWRSMFPPEAQLGRDIHWNELAHEFEMSGGLIKNAALRAAFLAVEAGTDITHEVLYRAALTELKDAGHVIRDDIHRPW